MFNKSITNSSRFIMMPLSTQALYFHLGMNADDDGFCEHFAIMRMTGNKPDELKILQAKGFIEVFDDMVLLINDWKENNNLRKDRYTPSKYLTLYKEELKRLSDGIPEVCLVIDKDIDTVKDKDTDIVKKKVSKKKVKNKKEVTDKSVKFPNRVLFNDTFYKFFKERGRIGTFKNWYNIQLQYFETYIKNNTLQAAQDKYTILLNGGWWSDNFSDMKNINKITVSNTKQQKEVVSNNNPNVIPDDSKINVQTVNFDQGKE